jgi:AraC-like DNA-binding protein/mannose-6-phosphate isomerase-like protein (cupin superfamily)
MRQTPKARRWLPEDVQVYTFEHPDFALSDANPIMTVAQRHDALRETGFDMHYFLEVGIILSGRMRRFYEGRQLLLGPGDVWFCGAWEPHGYRIEAAPCENVVVLVLPEVLSAFRCAEAPELNWLAVFLAAPRQRPSAAPAQRSAVLRLARQFKHYQEAAPRPSRIWLRTWLMELLLTVQEGWQAPADARNEPAVAPGRIDRALGLVFQKQRFIPEAEAARACGAGRGAFLKDFRRLMGISFAQFALRRRLSGAARLLLETDRPIKAVAAEWGFTDAGHLYRCFTRHYGCTPAAYRKQRKTK